MQVIASAAQLKAEGTGNGAAAGAGVGAGVGLGVGLGLGVVVGAEGVAALLSSAMLVTGLSPPPPPQADSVARTRADVSDMRRLCLNVFFRGCDVLMMMEFVPLWGPRGRGRCNEMVVVGALSLSGLTSNGFCRLERLLGGMCYDQDPRRMHQTK